MARVSSAIPSLINGVSQQPDELRMPSQCDEQINAYPSVVDGLIKRPPSEHVAKILDGQVGNALLHTINRDLSERYELVLTNGDLKVFDLEGSAKTVSFPDGKNYLSSANPSEDFRVLTVADYTFILNRTKKTAMLSELSSARGPEAIVFIKQASYSTTYRVWVDGRMFQVETTDGVTSAGVLPSREHLANVFDNDLGFSGTSNDGRTTKFSKTTHPTITCGATKPGCVSLSSDTYNWLVTFENVEADMTFWVTSSSQGTKYYDTPYIKHAKSIDSAGIASKLASEIAGAYPEFGVVATQSTIHLKREDGGDFTVQVEDSRSNTHMSVAKSRVQRFSDLPTVAPKDFLVEVVGDQTSNFDNYFVNFQCDNAGSSFDKGTWKETVKPGIKWKIDAATMPHALIREANGSFTFKPVEWGTRAAGDEQSAPEPSFIGRVLNDLFFYRNRLGVLADENVIMSRTGSFFDFFPATVTTILDTDPIDTAAGHTKVSILQHAVAFQEKLLFFSGQTQFILDYGEETLSPKTAAVKPLTEFECSTAVKPVGAGRTVFFAVDKGRYAGVREYFMQEDAGTNDAADITAHVPKYIPGGAFKFSASSNEDALVMLTKGVPNMVFLYKFYWAGNEKLQSAWGKIVLGNDAKMLNADFLENTLFLVLQYPDGVYLEKINIEVGRTDPDAPFVYCLDRRVDETRLIATYDAFANHTTFTFPYPIQEEPEIVTRHKAGSTFKPGVVLSVLDRPSDTRVVVNGRYDEAPVYAGLKYAMRYRFSKPVVKEQAPGGGFNVVGEGRLQILHWSLVYHDTGFFMANVTPLYRPQNGFKFTGRVVGSGSTRVGAVALSSGTFRFPILSRNDRFELEIVNDSYLPCRFVSAEWEGHFVQRSKRLT